MTIDLAAHHLAVSLSGHLRIRTAIIEGKLHRAQDMLFMRMQDVVNDYARGDVDSSDAELLHALETLNTSFGPRALLSMKEQSVHVPEILHATLN